MTMPNVVSFAAGWLLILIVSVHGGRVDGIPTREAVPRSVVFRIPIYERETPKSGTGEISLNDHLDITYTAFVSLGRNTSVPLIIDTGSSDMWAISGLSVSMQHTCSSLYSMADFQSSGMDVLLEYGDSGTGTYAKGIIGGDMVSLAGFTIQNHFFAAVNDTNTTVLQTGSVGILGLGFPLSSFIWRTLFSGQHTNMSQAANMQTNRNVAETHQPPPNPSERLLSARVFPDLRRLLHPLISPPDSQPLSPQNASSDVITEVLTSYATLGPFLPRLVANDVLSRPMFTVRLQRDADPQSTAGHLTIGGFPEGLDTARLVWTLVRGYPPSQGGLQAPSNAPDEVYPIAWEIPIDDVFLDGCKLPRSSLSSPNISLSALLDTGSSLIRGPADVVQTIYNQIGTTNSCADPHTLAFQISGRIFPVDPRDFVRQSPRNKTLCEPNLAPTDSPVVGSGYLYSWSLGTPFLKSVFATFYFGNLSYPSRDPPRIGLLSDTSLGPSPFSRRTAPTALFREETLSAHDKVSHTSTDHRLTYCDRLATSMQLD